jgi:hypothetical protein
LTGQPQALKVNKLCLSDGSRSTIVDYVISEAQDEFLSVGVGPCCGDVNPQTELKLPLQKCNFSNKGTEDEGKEKRALPSTP